MKIESQTLIAELLKRLDDASATVERFKNLDADALNARKNETSWSLLECLEHLNRYGYFYLPEIEKQILAQQPVNDKQIFKSGLLGNYLVNLIRLSASKNRPMKTAKDMNPIHAELPDKTISIFLEQQTRLRSLLQQSLLVDLNTTRTKTTLSPLITLRLGDTLRFMVYHIERHVHQAEATQF